MPTVEKPYTGLTAQVKIGDKILAYISGCSLSLSKDIIEILAFGMQYKEKVPSIKDWSLSCDGTVALTADGTQKELYDAFESGDEIELSLYLDDHTYFLGRGYVQSFDMEMAPDDKISLSSEISGNGATVLTITPPSP